MQGTKQREIRQELSSHACQTWAKHKICLLGLEWEVCSSRSTTDLRWNYPGLLESSPWNSREPRAWGRVKHTDMGQLTAGEIGRRGKVPLCEDTQILRVSRSFKIKQGFKNNQKVGKRLIKFRARSKKCKKWWYRANRWPPKTHFSHSKGWSSIWR